MPLFINQSLVPRRPPHAEWLALGSIEATVKRLILVLTSFYALSLLSYVSRPVALWLCGMDIAIVGILSVDLVWLLTLFLIPFARYFAFSSSNTKFLLSVALVACGLRLGSHVWKHSRTQGFKASAYSWILLLYCLLVALHFKDSRVAFELEGAGLLATAYLLFLRIRYEEPSRSRETLSLLEVTLVSSGIAAALLTAAYLYFPLPQLIVAHPEIRNLRLAGVTDESNSMARFLLPAFSCFLARSVLYRSKRGLWYLLLALTSMLLAATETKAALVAILAMFIVIPFLAGPRRRWWSLPSILVATLSILWWLLYIGPRLEYQAAAVWVSLPNTHVSSLLASPYEQLTIKHSQQLTIKHSQQLTIKHSLLRELRIGRSSKMLKDKEGRTTYIRRPNDIWKTGQRDRLWKAGIAVVTEHPLWGIGYKAWRQELMKRLDYPFVAPHDALLQVVGSYGIVGGILYVALLAAFLRRTVQAREAGAVDWVRHGVIWPTLICGALFVFELFDEATSLGVTIMILWVWGTLGLQEAFISNPLQRNAISS